ncbi:hypothetical protein GGR57DRAFT_512067 [Xylariaceae sp. FL1272]|nr:hypothetical protein GGR57DRAFT_512067 [Xylariaceae sp. FL1272]
MPYSRAPRSADAPQFKPIELQQAQPSPIRPFPVRFPLDEMSSTQVQHGQSQLGQPQQGQPSYGKFQQAYVQQLHQPVFGEPSSERNPLHPRPRGPETPLSSASLLPGFYYFDGAHMYRREPSPGPTAFNTTDTNVAGKNAQNQDVSRGAPGLEDHRYAHDVRSTRLVAGQTSRQLGSRQALPSPGQTLPPPFTNDGGPYTPINSGQPQKTLRWDSISSFVPHTNGSNDSRGDDHNPRAMPMPIDLASGSMYGNGRAIVPLLQIPARGQRFEQLGYPTPQGSSENDQDSSGKDDDEGDDYDEDDPKPMYIAAPQSAFMMYRTSRCREIKAANPGIWQQGISKIAGHEWRNLPPEEKAHWIDQRAKLGEEYRKRGLKRTASKADFKRKMAAWMERQRQREESRHKERMKRIREEERENEREKKKRRAVKCGAPQRGSQHLAQPPIDPPMTRLMRQSASIDILMTPGSPAGSHHSMPVTFEEMISRQMLKAPLSHPDRGATDYTQGDNEESMQHRWSHLDQATSDSYSANTQMVQPNLPSNGGAPLPGAHGSTPTGAPSDAAHIEGNMNVNQLLAEVEQDIEGVQDWWADLDFPRFEAAESQENHDGTSAELLVEDHGSMRNYFSERGEGSAAAGGGTNQPSAQNNVPSQDSLVSMGSGEVHNEAGAALAPDSQNWTQGHIDKRTAGHNASGVDTNPPVVQSQDIAVRNREHDASNEESPIPTGNKKGQGRDNAHPAASSQNMVKNRNIQGDEKRAENSGDADKPTAQHQDAEMLFEQPDFVSEEFPMPVSQDTTPENWENFLQSVESALQDAMFDF